MTTRRAVPRFAGLGPSIYELWWRSSVRHRLRFLRGLVVRRLRTPEPEEDDDLREPAPSRALVAVKRFASSAFLVLVSAVAAIALGEITLRVRAIPFPRDLRTSLFQCYAPEYEGAHVSFLSPTLGITLLKPNFDATCCWNGYLWNHRTDQWGFRNPESWEQVDVVLLGDSMIYGHGVEENQTVAHFLRERLHRRVANLAFMGDSMPEELGVLRNFGLARRPKVAVAFVFQNDLDDILVHRRDAELHRFIDTGEAPEARVVPEAQLLAESKVRPASFGAHLLHEFMTYRTLQFYLSHQGDGVAAPPQFTNGHPALPDVPVNPPEPTVEEALAILYLRRGLQTMKAACDEAHVRLVVAFLPGLQEPDARTDRLIFYQVREAAADYGVPFLDATLAMVDEEGNVVRGARLEYDGHLAELGHRRLANIVGKFIEERGLLDDTTSR